MPENITSWYGQKMSRHPTKNAIVSTSRRLFLDKGYEATSVQEIIDSLSIAKGAFYHHFGSKEEVLDAIIEDLCDELNAGVREIIEDARLTPVEKLNRIILLVEGRKKQNQDAFTVVFQAAFAGGRLMTPERLLTTIVESAKPYWTAVVRQGVADGSFITEYPEELAFISLRMAFSWVLILSSEIRSRSTKTSLRRRLEQWGRAYEESLNRLFGTAPGTIAFGRILGIESLLTVAFRKQSGDRRAEKE